MWLFTCSSEKTRARNSGVHTSSRASRLGHMSFFLLLEDVDVSFYVSSASPYPEGRVWVRRRCTSDKRLGGTRGKRCQIATRSCHTEAAVGDGPAAQRLPEPRSAPRCGSSVQPQGDFSRCGRRGGAGGGAADAERIIVGPLVTLSRCRFAYMRRGTCDSAARRPERVFERRGDGWQRRERVAWIVRRRVAAPPRLPLGYCVGTGGVLAARRADVR